MDSFELNKIIGAVLGTCLILLVTSFTASALFAPKMPEKPGFAIAAKEAAGGAKEAAAAPSEPIEKLLQTASVEKGQAAAKVCTTCHTFEKDGPNRVGPNLYGIVGEKTCHRQVESAGLLACVEERDNGFTIELTSHGGNAVGRPEELKSPPL